MRRRGKFYEQALLSRIRAMELHGTYVDVGAHIGNHSVWFGAHCHYCHHVISIEPHPDLFPLLTNNLHRNLPVGKWSAYNCALAAEEGVLRMGPLPPKNSGKAKVADNGVEVSARRLDDLDLGKEHVPLIKVDVEGYELEVLKGGMKTIGRHSPVITVECWTGYDLGEVLGLLGNYRVEARLGTRDTYLLVPI